jgi:GT2 family glycosyltransferase
MRTLTVAICSYQRRDLLLSQLTTMERWARLDAADWDGVDVLVVLDGSRDGSLEALERLALSLPFRFYWQPNAGRSAARNSLLRMAQGEVIWLLDDDLIPARECITRHRLSHEQGEDHLFLGSCLFPLDVSVSPGVRRWWDERNSRLAERGVIGSFTEFSVANLSAPLRLFTDAGGFKEEFVDYGMEDNELGARLLAAGHLILFDADAVVWHHSSVTERETFLRQRSLGRNAVILAALHPQEAGSAFPEQPASPFLRVIAKLPAGSAAVSWCVARTAYRLLTAAEPCVGRRAWRLRRLAWQGAYSAGVLAASEERHG